jgi:hypothetical protein
MYKVWNISTIDKGRNKGRPCYLSPRDSTERVEWCKKNAPNSWLQTMGYFDFDLQEDADAFRNLFGECGRPEY